LWTPSHVKESFTAAIVVQSLWAAERSRLVVGVFVGWVVARLEVCWPVLMDMVVAVDIGSPLIFLRMVRAKVVGMPHKSPLLAINF